MLDRTKLKTQVRNELTTDVFVNGQTVTVENENRGGFTASWRQSLPAANPPVVPSGKGFQSRIHAVSGTLIYRNCQSADIGRTTSELDANNKPVGVHTDFIWLASNATSTGYTIEILDCACSNIAGEGVHFDGGSLKRFHIARTVLRTDDGNRCTLKLQPGCSIGDIVVDGLDGLFIFDATQLGPNATFPTTLYLNNYAGPAPVAAVTRNASVVNVPAASLGIKIVNGLPPDLKPADPHSMHDVIGATLTFHRSGGDGQGTSRTIELISAAVTDGWTIGNGGDAYTFKPAS